MSPVSYPRPDLPEPCASASSRDSNELPWGIAQILLSGGVALWALGGCLTDELSPPGGRVLALRLIGVQGIADPMAEVHLTACFALALLILTLVRMVAGVGVARSRKWGFTLTAGVSIVLTVAGLAALPDPFAAMGVVFGGVSAFYAVRRLAGKDESRFA